MICRCDVSHEVGIWARDADMTRAGARSTARRTPQHRAAQNGPTGRPAGLREVAELARVAASSVSRVLTGHPDVSPAMRQRVLDAVAELRYEPDFVAQSLRRGVTMSVGVILRDISSLFMSQIVASAEPVLRAAGYSLLLM